MPKNPLSGISLKKPDELFTTEEQRQEERGERICMLPLTELHVREDNPVSIQESDVTELGESIHEKGVHQPIIVRPRESGGYEIIDGRHRKMGAELAQLTEIPCIIRDYDEDEAIIVMTDTILKRRQELLPSEKAKTYKMRLDAIKRQGERSDLTSVQVGQKLVSRDNIAKETGESSTQIQRYIRLNELIPPLQQMTDSGKMAFGIGVELSYLPPEKQTELLNYMTREESTHSLTQAQRLKKFSQEGKLDSSVMEAIITEEKPQQNKVTLKGDKLAEYFPKSFTPHQMEEIIFKLLESWKKKQRDREPER